MSPDISIPFNTVNFSPTFTFPINVSLSRLLIATELPVGLVLNVSIFTCFTILYPLFIFNGPVVCVKLSSNVQSL